MSNSVSVLRFEDDANEDDEVVVTKNQEGEISISLLSDPSYGFDLTLDELKMIYEIFKPA